MFMLSCEAPSLEGDADLFRFRFFNTGEIDLFLGEPVLLVLDADGFTFRIFFGVVRLAGDDFFFIAAIFCVTFLFARAVFFTINFFVLALFFFYVALSVLDITFKGFFYDLFVPYLTTNRFFAGDADFVFRTFATAFAIFSYFLNLL